MFFAKRIRPWGLTPWKPNQKKPIILVKERGKRCKVPSDIISDYHYTFSDITELEALFATHMKEILASDYGMVFQK